jgi:CheY-like chemotaxis protein
LRCAIRILVVDDDPDSRDLVCALLENAHAVVVMAATVDEALRIVQREHVDALLTDIAMPGSAEGIRTTPEQSIAEGGGKAHTVDLGSRGSEIQISPAQAPG